MERGGRVLPRPIIRVVTLADIMALVTARGLPRTVMDARFSSIRAIASASKDDDADGGTALIVEDSTEEGGEEGAAIAAEDSEPPAPLTSAPAVCMLLLLESLLLLLLLLLLLPPRALSAANIIEADRAFECSPTAVAVRAAVRAAMALSAARDALSAAAATALPNVEVTALVAAEAGVETTEADWRGPAEAREEAAEAAALCPRTSTPPPLALRLDPLREDAAEASEDILELTLCSSDRAAEVEETACRSGLAGSRRECAKAVKLAERAALSSSALPPSE